MGFLSVGFRFHKILGSGRSPPVGPREEERHIRLSVLQHHVRDLPHYLISGLGLGLRITDIRHTKCSCNQMFEEYWLAVKVQVCRSRSALVQVFQVSQQP